MVARDDEGDVHDDDPPLTREQRREELARRRADSRRRQRSSQVLGIFFFVAIVGIGLWVMKPSLRGLLSRETVSESSPSGLLEEAIRLAREGQVDEARERVEEAAAGAETAEDRDAVDAARRQLGQLEARWKLAISRLGEADRHRSNGRLADAQRILEELHRDFVDLPPLRDRVWDRLSRIETTREERGGVAELLAYDAEAVARVEALLEQQDFAAAHALVESIETEDDDEAFELAGLRRRVREEAEGRARALLARVDYLVSKGKILVAVQSLYKEEIEGFRHTDLWIPMLERAEEIEDIIDSRGGRRPFPRRRHLPRDHRKDRP